MSGRLLVNLSVMLHVSPSASSLVFTQSDFTPVTIFSCPVMVILRPVPIAGVALSTGPPLFLRAMAEAIPHDPNRLPL